MGRREGRGRQGRREVRWRLVAPNGEETAASGQPLVSRYDAKRVVDVKTRATAAGIIGVTQLEGTKSHPLDIAS